MARGPEDRYQALVQHPVREIDDFLNDFDLEPEWMGVLGGPHIDDDGELVLSYNVRTLDGPYKGMVGAEFDYRAPPDSGVELQQLYPAQAAAIEAAVPDATVQCYVPEAWQE